MKKSDWAIDIAAENAFIVYCNLSPLIQSNMLISCLNDILKRKSFPWLISLVPAYKSLLVTYDVLNSDHYVVAKDLAHCIDCIANTSSQESIDNGAKAIIEIPVCYGYSQYNDLDRVEKISGLSKNEIITLHSEPVYQVFCLGFAPGFAYLGEVDKRICIPRLDSPRKSVPKGAVAIAERQTAIYPNESPGGWNILGLCPLMMFSRQSDTPCRIQTGDQVKFVPIDHDQFLEIEQQEGKMWPI